MMPLVGHSNPETALEFARVHGVNLALDLEETYTNRALLKELDTEGTTSLQISADDGTNYQYTQIDFFKSEDLIAGRKLATINPGDRTELAIWKQNAPTKHLTVHQGIGALVVARVGSESAHSYRLDPKITPSVKLPPNVAYTFEADETSYLPLVVSGIYSAKDLEIDWSEMEIPFAPGETTVKTDSRKISIPAGFSARYHI